MLNIGGYQDMHSEMDRQSFEVSSCAQEPDTTITSPAATKSCKRKRREGKAPIVRALFSKTQVAQLEKRFREQSFLSKEERQELARDVGITDRQVMIWFQNRRGRLKKRGPLDGAYNPAKLQEINVRRPYPFLCGVITNQHQYRPNPTSNQQFSVYPKEVQSHIETVIGQLPSEGRSTLEQMTGDSRTRGTRGDDAATSTPPPNVTVFDMSSSDSGFRHFTSGAVNCNQSVTYPASVQSAFSSRTLPQYDAASTNYAGNDERSEPTNRCPTQGVPSSFMFDLVSSRDSNTCFASTQALYVNTSNPTPYNTSTWPPHQHTPILTTLPHTLPYGYPQSHPASSSAWCDQVPHMSGTPHTSETSAQDYAKMPGYAHYNHAHYNEHYANWTYQHNLPHTAKN